MGTGLLSKPSSPIHFDYKEVKEANVDQVAKWFKSLGSEYTIYASAAAEHGIDGALLCRLSSNELSQLLESLSMTNPIHIQYVTPYFHELKNVQRIASGLPAHGEQIHDNSQYNRHESSNSTTHTVSFKSTGTSPLKQASDTLFRKQPIHVARSPLKPHKPTIRSKSENCINISNQTREYQAYFSYATGTDRSGCSMRQRVAAVHAALIRMGVVVWFDSEKSIASTTLIDQGLLHSRVAVVFLTRSYMNQINSDGVMASCQYEFTMALRYHKMHNIIFCVMEEDMMRFDSLSGEFRELAGDAACMDFTDDSSLADACDELAETILRLDRDHQSFVDKDDLSSLGVNALVRLLKQPSTTPEYCDQILQSMIGMAMQSRYADKLVAKGILSYLLSWIKPQSRSVRVLELTLLLIKVLARSNAVTRRKIASIMTEMNLLPQFAEHLKSGEGVIKENTAGMLRNVFAGGEVNVIEVNEPFKKIVGLLLDLFANGTINQQYESASALGAIAVNRDFQPVIVQANGIQMCLEVLTSWRAQEGVIDNAAMILRYLCATETNQREIGLQGGIEVFLNLLEFGSPIQRETSSAALNWLMEVEDNLNVLINEDGIAFLIHFLVYGSQFVQQQVLNALCKMAHHSHFHIHLADGGAFEPCLTILQRGTDSQKSSACLILSAISSTEKVEDMGSAIPAVTKLFSIGSMSQRRIAADLLTKLSRQKHHKQTITHLVGDGKFLL